MTISASDLDRVTAGVNELKAAHAVELTAIKAENIALRRDLEALEVEFARPGAAFPGAPRDEETRHPTVAAFIREGAVAEGLATGRLRPRNAASVGDDPHGGFYVFPQQRSVEKLMKELDPISADALSEDLEEGDAVEYLISKNNATSGMVSEMGARSETDVPDLVKIRVPVAAWYAEPHASTRLLTTAKNVEGWLTDAVADARYATLAAYYHTGDGITRPRGFLDYPTATTSDASRPFGTLQYVPTADASGFIAPSTTASPMDCLVDLHASLRTPYRANAAWYLSRATLAVVQKFKDPDGRLLVRDPVGTGAPFTMLGSPIRLDEHMPSISGGAYPIAFADMRQGYVRVQLPMLVIRDPFTTKGRVKFYHEQLVGGGVKNSEAIKLLKVAST